MDEDTPTYFHREWEIATGRQTRSFDLALPPTHIRVIAQAYSADESQLIQIPLLAPEDSVAINLQTGQVTRFKPNVLEANYAIYSPDEKQLIISSRKGYLRFLDAATYRETETVRGFMFAAGQVTFSPEGGRMAATGTGSESVKVMDYASRERLLTIVTDAT